jgi:hypothetical protein
MFFLPFHILNAFIIDYIHSLQIQTLTISIIGGIRINELEIIKLYIGELNTNGNNFSAFIWVLVPDVQKTVSRALMISLRDVHTTISPTII